MTNKEAYLKKAQAKLDEWNADLDKMKAKLSAADADAKIKLDESIKELEVQRNEMKRKLDEIERAGEDAWEDMRDGMESAWHRVTTSIKDAVNRFK